jgi:hypothetical protein
MSLRQKTSPLERSNFDAIQIRLEIETSGRL